MSRLIEDTALGLLAAEGVPVSRYGVAETPEEAAAVAARLGGPVVLKALIPTGGRGKAGAVRRAATPEAAAAAARNLLGRKVLQFPVERLLVAEALEAEQELFASFTFDSMSRRPLLLFSALGGVEIETILRDSPAALIRRPILLGRGLEEGEAAQVALEAGLAPELAPAAGSLLARLYGLFRRLEAQTLEINPLMVTAEGRILVPTGVIVLDDQAAFRHPELAALSGQATTNGWRPLTPLERRMREIDATATDSAIRFNELDGDIGFMVTGGGAGMLALDHILRIGGKPATTFDITPGRVEEKMYLATLAVLSKPGLKGLLVGGNITNFIPIDVKVRGVVRALKESRIDPRRFPLVFRFAGPGVEEGKRLASEIPGIHYIDAAGTLEEAVELIVALTQAPSSAAAGTA